MKEKIDEIKNQKSVFKVEEKEKTPKKATVFPNEVQVSIAPIVIREGRRSRLKYDKKTLRRVESPPYNKLVIIGENSTSKSRKNDLRSGKLSRRIENEIGSIGVDTTQFSKDENSDEKKVKEVVVVEGRGTRDGRFSENVQIKRELNFRDGEVSNKKMERVSIKSSGMKPRSSRVLRPSNLVIEDRSRRGVRPASPTSNTVASVIRTSSARGIIQKPQQAVIVQGIGQNQLSQTSRVQRLSETPNPRENTFKSKQSESHQVA